MGRFGRMGLKRVISCMKRVASPGSMHDTGCLGLCTGTTQRDGVGREEGGGFRMGSTCIPVADLFCCLAKLIQCLRFKNKINLKKKARVNSVLPKEINFKYKDTY